jgi:Holliday junction resolvase-like predicted endonuclease/predicted transcriptional regulator
MNSFLELKKTTRIIVPKNWTNNQKADFFEQLAGKILKPQRYKVIQRVRFTGMEIDLIADHLDTNQRIFVECKFVVDPISSNVIFDIVGKAVTKGIKIAYLFSTASLGKEAKGVIDELEEKKSKDIPKIVFINPEKLTDMFIDIFDAKPDLPETLVTASISVATLIITPNFSPFWILEEYQNGIPTRAFIQSALSKEKAMPSDIEVSKILKENDLSQGLELIFEGSPKKKTADSRKAKTERNYPEEEVIASVAVADSLDDYRPCKPEHFVGRNDIQRNILQFLHNVRDDATSTRILALSGPSGFGKSSVILKLADRFHNIKWRNKFYIFSVDVRSARSPLFVAKALKTSLQSAINSGFIPMQILNIAIESTGSFLQSDSIQLALELLKSNKRVLVLFFDQFEEMLTKDELLSTFESFKKLAFEVHSSRANIVVGFSWRTGITLSDDNPAYHVWHDLKDLRRDITLGEFTSAESSQLILQFEHELSENLLPPLRRRLLEQGQGLPWLLKKLCIHVYGEIKKGTQQEELLSRRLNIKSLFDEDLEILTERQIQCLKYIAKKSPADFLDIINNFEQEIVNGLYSKRLIVRAGQKYAVYWDIFREYLVENTIPPIPWTYVPQVQFSMAILSFFLLRSEGPLDLNNLAKKLRYTEKTVLNIVTDLQNFLLINRHENGKYSVRPEVINSNDKEISIFLNKQLKEHIIVQKLFEILAPDDSISIDDFGNIIAISYAVANLKPESINAYRDRFLPWLRCVGLLDISGDILTRPLELGKDFGKFDFRSRRFLGNILKFVCSTSPQKVFDLATELAKQGSISKNEIYKHKKRNASYDLIGLGLAFWRNKILFPSDLLVSALNESENKVLDIISSRALSSEFLQALLPLLKSNLKIPLSNIGIMLSKRLNKNWSESSALRYASAGKLWLSFFKRV